MAYKNNSLLVGLDDDVNIDSQHQFQETKFLGMFWNSSFARNAPPFETVHVHAMPCHAM